jgi:hypothetical protein
MRAPNLNPFNKAQSAGRGAQLRVRSGFLFVRFLRPKGLALEIPPVIPVRFNLPKMSDHSTFCFAVVSASWLRSGTLGSGTLGSFGRFGFVRTRWLPWTQSGCTNSALISRQHRVRSRNPQQRPSAIPENPPARCPLAPSSGLGLPRVAYSSGASTIGS